MRINKYLSQCGVCSRREADRLIEAGRVTIDGQTAVSGAQADPGMSVRVDGREVRPREQKVYLKFYKPVGIVCTADRREKNNIVDFLHYPVRITYAGRLDKNSEGLILMTDDGDLIHEVMTGRNLHEKEYIVRVDGSIPDGVLQEMAGGVWLQELQVRTRPCKITRVDSCTFRIILTEGLNREIRRMCGAFHFQVCKLKRVRIMNLELGDLKPGQYCEVTEEELSILRKQLLP